MEENTPGRYVTVYQPRGNAEASLWKERLKAEGIKAEIINENAAMTHNALIELQVREKDAPKAYEILKEAPGNSVKPVSLWQLIFGFFGQRCFIDVRNFIVNCFSATKVVWNIRNCFEFSICVVEFLHFEKPEIKNPYN